GEDSIWPGDVVYYRRVPSDAPLCINETRSPLAPIVLSARGLCLAEGQPAAARRPLRQKGNLMSAPSPRREPLAPPGQRPGVAVAELSPYSPPEALGSGDPPPA